MKITNVRTNAVTVPFEEYVLPKTALTGIVRSHYPRGPDRGGVGGTGVERL